MKHIARKRHSPLYAGKHGRFPAFQLLTAFIRMHFVERQRNQLRPCAFTCLVGKPDNITRVGDDSDNMIVPSDSVFHGDQASSLPQIELPSEAIDDGFECVEE